MNKEMCRYFDIPTQECDQGVYCRCIGVKPVNPINPAHYKLGTVECFDAIASQLTRDELIGYLRGNITKYLWRYKHKNGVEDIEKADWYFNKLKEMERGK